jgi:hypothetical protein
MTDFDSVIQHLYGVLGNNYEAKYYVGCVKNTHMAILDDFKAGNADPKNERAKAWKLAVNDCLHHIVHYHMDSEKALQINSLMENLRQIHNNMVNI